MAVSYPTTIAAFTYRIDNRSKVVAADVNSAYDEIVAIQTQLGAGGVTSSLGWSGTFNQTSTGWNSLKDRIQNIEYGLGGIVSLVDGGTPTSA